MWTTNSTSSSTDTTEQIIIGVSSSISIFCSILILTTFVCLREVQTLTRQIIICMTIADLLTALSNLIGAIVIHGQFHINPINNIVTVDDKFLTSWCSIQSFVSSTSSLWSFLWTMVLSLALHYVIVKEKVEKIVTILPWLHVVCWLLPLFINLIALVDGKLGYSEYAATGGWCWIATNVHSEAVLWMTVDGKFIEILTYLVITYYFILIKKHLRKKLRKISRASTSSLTKKDSVVDAMRLLEKKLIFLPFLLITLRIWGTIRYLLVVCHLNIKNNTRIRHFDRVLSYLQAVGDSSQATVNFIIFCACTPKIRSRIFSWVQSGNCCNSSSTTLDEEENERKSLIPKP